MKEGDLIFARMKGYRPWPARILNASESGKINVFFYGSYQVGVVKIKDAWPFNDETKLNLGKAPAKGKNVFQRAMKEIMETPEISDNLGPPDSSFVDESSSPASFTPQITGTVAPKRGRKPHRKLYIRVKDTDDMVEVDLDKNKPKFFNSREEEEKWEKENTKKMLQFKRLVENGSYVPEEVYRRLENKEDRTDKENALLVKWRHLKHDRREKIAWINMEMKLIVVDLRLRKSLDIEGPNLDECMETLQILQNLTLTPLMLKKQPQVVETLMKVSSYVGPKDMQLDEEKVKRTREKAKLLFTKIQGCFDVPENADFMDYFNDLVAQFRERVRFMSNEEVSTMTSEI